MHEGVPRRGSRRFSGDRVLSAAAFAAAARSARGVQYLQGRKLLKSFNRPADETSRAAGSADEPDLRQGRAGTVALDKHEVGEPTAELQAARAANWRNWSGPRPSGNAVPDEVLQATAAGVSAATGEEFFRLLARHLADSLGCEYCRSGRRHRAE